MVMSCGGVRSIIHHQRSSGQSSCICTARRQIGARQQALQTAAALMKSRRTGVGTQMWNHTDFREEPVG